MLPWKKARISYRRLPWQMDCDPCLEWAFKAHRDYLKGIGVQENDQEAFLKDEITVVLLGATQQGKSSLALRLLGAEPEQIPRLDEALSARDRMVGKSCTRATTILRATGRDDYEKKLDRIEEQVRQNATDANHELHLELPLVGGKTTRIRRVVDLVGLESGTDSEERQKLAREQTQKWLRIADLKVVVVRASSITDIVVGKYSYAYDAELRELFGYWHVNPHTSFIAVTHAWEDTRAFQVEGEELAHLLEGGYLPEEIHRRTEEYLRNVLRRELEKAATQQEFPDVSLLPLCLAHEINLVDSKERLMYEATEISLERLRKRITEEQPLMFRLKSAFDHPRKIEWEIQRDVEKLEKEQARLQRERQKHSEKKHEEDQKLSENTEEVKAEESSLEAAHGLPGQLAVHVLNSLHGCSLSLPRIEGLRKHQGGFLEPHKTNMKKHLLYLWDTALQDAVTDALDAIRKWSQSNEKPDSMRVPVELRSVVSSPKIRDSLQKQLRSLELTLDQLDSLLPERWHKDDGWPAARLKLRDRFKSKLNSNEDRIVSALKRIFEGSHGYKDYLSQTEKRLSLYQENSKNEQVEIEQLSKKREKFIRDLEIEIAPIETELEQKRRALMTARRYKHILSDHYESYWNSRVSVLNMEATPDEDMIELLCELDHSANCFKELTAVQGL